MHRQKLCKKRNSMYINGPLFIHITYNNRTLNNNLLEIIEKKFQHMITLNVLLFIKSTLKNFLLSILSTLNNELPEIIQKKKQYIQVAYLSTVHKKK